MNAVKIPISQCTEEDILAVDITDGTGRILLVKDTMINDYIKTKLADRGIFSIQIYKPCTDVDDRNDKIFNILKHDYKNTVVLCKKIIDGLVAGKKLNYDNILVIAKSIFNNIDQGDQIVRCINEMRCVDQYTYTHSVNTAFYSMLIAKWIGLKEKEVNGAIQAGLLHDIGKTLIPQEILNKKERLTAEEFELIKKHTQYGYDILCEMKEIHVEVKRAALLHHERMDGSGYPLRPCYDSVGIYARIVAIADVFDAMTSDRIYKVKKTPFESFQMFKSIGVGIFDPTILNIFLKNISSYFTGANVLLDTGEEGEIVYIPPHDILSPIIKVGSGYVDFSKKRNVKISQMI